MTTFQVDDMTCGHCVSTITKAVKGVDADARVTIDMAAHRVDIESTKTTASQLSAVIEEAGYSPVSIAHPVTQPIATRPSTRGGCCCH